MCNVCGCGAGETRIEGQPADDEQMPARKWVRAGAPDPHFHRHADGSPHSHAHDEAPADGSIHYGHGPAGAEVPGMSSPMVKIEQDILSKTTAMPCTTAAGWPIGAFCAEPRLPARLGQDEPAGTHHRGRSWSACRLRWSGRPADQLSDAERIWATGAPALQINTGKGCHLDARMVGQALEKLAPPDNGLLLIENVWPLVCRR